MQESQIPRFSWDMIAIDTTGPYPNSNSGNIYLYLIVMNLMTSYPKAYPDPPNYAKPVVEVLTEKLIPMQLCPTTTLSDNHTEYLKKDCRESIKKLGITSIFMSPYLPQSNKNI